MDDTGFNKKLSRRQRIGELRESILNVTRKGKCCDKEKLLAYMSMEWACARRTVKEYLDTMALLKEVVIYKDEVVASEKLLNCQHRLLDSNIDEAYDAMKEKEVVLSPKHGI